MLGLVVCLPEPVQNLFRTTSKPLEPTWNDRGRLLIRTCSGRFVRRLEPMWTHPGGLLFRTCSDPLVRSRNLRGLIWSFTYHNLIRPTGKKFESIWTHRGGLLIRTCPGPLVRSWNRFGLLAVGCLSELLQDSL